MGTAKVENALVLHSKVAESAILVSPRCKGQRFVYVTLNAGEEYTDDLKKELKAHVRQVIGPITTPDVIHWAPGVTKS